MSAGIPGALLPRLVPPEPNPAALGARPLSVYPTLFGWCERVATRTLVDMTSTDEHKRTIVDLIERLFGNGDTSAVDDHVDDALVFHDPPFGLTPDKSGMLGAAKIVRDACPDWRSDVQHLVAEGDLVAEHFIASGTHTGADLMGVPPSGNVVTLAGFQLFRMDGGRVVERWGRIDELGVLGQLGLLPEAMRPPTA